MREKIPTHNDITWLLDPGHGGMSIDHNGEYNLYLTKGKRSPTVPPGIYEGEFNHNISERVYVIGKKRGLKIQRLAVGPVDIPLKSRIKHANEMHKVLGNCFYLSIHANASPKKAWSDAHGPVFFHHPNSKQGAVFASILNHAIWSNVYEYTRGLKTSRWMKVLRSTKMPACLAELGFMTNKLEAQFMSTDIGRDLIAHEICISMMAFQTKIKAYRDTKSFETPCLVDGRWF